MLVLPHRIPGAGQPHFEPCTVPLSAPAATLLGGPDGHLALAALSHLLLHRYGTGWEVLGAAGDTPVRYVRAEDQETGTLEALTGAARPAAARPPVDGEPYVAVLSARPVTLPAALGRPVWTAAAEGPGLCLTYDSTVLDAATAERVAAHLALLAHHAAQRPLTPAGTIDLLGPHERELLLDTWNAPHTPHTDTTLHRMIREQAARTPDAIALRDGAAELTYGALDAASDRFAHRLRPHVDEPGALVVLTGDRDLTLFTAVLGIWKAGAGFVHLDPHLPDLRAEEILRLTAPVATLTTASGHRVVAGRALDAAAFLRQPLPGNRPTAAGDPPGAPDDRAGAPADPPGAPDDRARPDTTAYVLFTSGSTGAPKGVVRPHRMHTSRIRLEQGMYAMGPDDRHLLKSPISFREFAWPLATGGTAVLAAPGKDRDDRYLAELIHDQRVTTVSFVPSMLRLLLTQPAFRTAPALRHVFVGGEALGQDLEDELRGLGFAVHNTYTLSEADYVCHRTGPLAVPRPEGAPGTVVGVPLDMRIYLCDAAGRLVPPGVVGEIHTGGPGLADGYLGRPDLTAERFRPNRLDPAGPEVLFRTGDLARHLPDGQVEYVGRADDQVKVRGQRVEPVEVETVLRAHPGVANAAVVGTPDPDQGAVLVAYVVPEGDEVPHERLREHLAARLPDFMVPAHLASVPALPLLGSGKVDRKALRVPPRTRPALDVPYAPPTTPDQERAAALVARVLGLDTVGVDDDFFDLGGDSLRLMLLRGSLESACGREIALADVFAARTPRGHARLLGEASEHHGTGTGAVPARRPAERRRPPQRGSAAPAVRTRTRPSEGGEPR
ncbi:amino acid adenylation domain-containing protein [Streptomyces antarcticus]|uniref:amino acid adenylation domain-containing protein n=1 Tax=Streptomyces antarcticus TaxID=2996458 RepID=UPI002270711F|nr:MULTISPECIES: amino acid adenylation domain-containing protein [unclassified Streptomyces]MCY0941024.1 amino acid adenylation domain-containing protein [Streptomyces sp. H34-AA3]MCZ4085582.1 amino acid adenylation domain-containing protein [Streptomyces sp. H34-S5]